MKRRLRVLVAALASVGAASVGAGCSREAPPPAQGVEATGTLAAYLTGIGQQGVEYELRKGVFKISGPVSLEFSSEDFRGETHVEQRLGAGAYSIELQDGWFLERKGANGNEAVEAELVSDNPVKATVTKDETTEVSFRFKVGDDEVELGSGSLVTSIEIDDGPTSIVVTDFEPVPKEIPAIDGQGTTPRPVGAFSLNGGEVMEFVSEELIVAGVEGAELEALLAEFGGKLLKSVGKSDPVHLVSIAGANVDTESVEVLLQGEELGTLDFSSDAALRTFAAAILIGESGQAIAAPNFVMHSSSLEDRELAESPTGPSGYTPNPFEWTTHSRHSAQDIGVAEAWRALDYHERIGPAVPVLVLDGGFRNVPDLPPGTTFVRGTFDQPNPSGCGSGNPCLWHGTDVVGTLGGRVDNGFAAAGTGLNVRPLLVQAPGDFFQVVDFVLSALAGAGASRIVNMSGGFWIDQGVCDAPFAHLFCDAISAAALILTAGDNLIVAAAGNDGRNIGTDAYYVPCEAPGVFCVAGLAPDSRLRASGSNYSFTGSVDLWAPYETYVGVDPAGDGSVNGVRAVQGTSHAAPFVAGVAALVQMADPSLNSDAIERILMETAHRGSGSRVAPRWVNAYAAVSRALGGGVPPFIEIVAPSDGTSRPRRLTRTSLVADVEDADPGAAVTWTSSIDGTIGTGADTSVLGLSIGEHVITATVSSDGFTHSDSVTLTLTNQPPDVSIIAPVAGGSYFSGTTFFLSGESGDLNEDEGRLSNDQVRWFLDGALVATGHSATLSAGVVTPGTHTLVFQGSDGEFTASDDVTFVVQDPGGDVPPSIVSMLPADGADLGYADETVGGDWFLDVNLSAQATDDGGTLPESAFVWTETFTHDATGTVTRSLGSGRNLAVQLQGLCFAVDHFVTLTVTDAAGQVTTRTHRMVVHLLC